MSLRERADRTDQGGWRRPRLLPLATAGLAALITLAAAGAQSIPGGTAAFFSVDGSVSGTCPDGWQEMPDAAGRLIVGVTDGHEVGGTVGRALADGEEPVHSHHISTSFILAKKSLNALSSCCNRSAADNTTHKVAGTALDAPTGLPFIQLLMCEKSARSVAGAMAGGADAAEGGAR